MITPYTTCPIDEYHADPRPGRSMLMVYEKCPETYRAMYVDNPPTMEPKAPTPVMRFGSCIDQSLETLQPPDDNLPPNVRPLPKEIKVRSMRHAKYRTLVEDNPGVEWWNATEVEEYYKPARAWPTIAAQLMAHDWTRFFWESDKVAQPTFLMDDWKSRPDWLLTGEATVDIKTTEDVRAHVFARKVRTFGVDMQMAMAFEAVDLTLQQRLPPVLVAIQNVEPYRVECYHLHDVFLADGLDRFMTAISGVRNLRWRSQTHGRCVTLRRPSEFQDLEDA